MSTWKVILIAVGLAMDAFAVSVSAGTSGRAVGRRAAFRLAFHFGLFQALMPVLGWWLGTRVAARLAPVDHWLAFGLLAFIGARMVRAGLAPDGAPRAGDPSRGASLLMLSVATSIDAFAVGLSLAMLQVRIWEPAAVIGVVTALMTWFGHRAGSRLRGAMGQDHALGGRLEVAGGILLILVGLNILVGHLRV
ncbi:MAG: manganese efflux pump MntP family protein [Desulfobacterales bacterium]|nr:manganese efflux pump MntP family protein [Desulfobacterales bacterium]